MSLSLLIYFYGFSFEEVKELTLYQFSILLNKIPEIQNAFLGGKTGTAKNIVNPNEEKVIAQSLGIFTP